MVQLNNRSKCIRIESKGVVSDDSQPDDHSQELSDDKNSTPSGNSVPSKQGSRDTVPSSLKSEMKIDSLLYIECRSDRDECRKSVRKGAKKATLHFRCRNCFTYNAREKHIVCIHAKKCTNRKLPTEKVGKTDNYLQCSIVDANKCS